MTRGEAQEKKATLAFPVGRRVEVGRLGRDPAKKAGDAGMRAKGGRIAPRSGKLHIAELRMDGPMTDWMDGHRFAPASAFRHRMMPFNPFA